MAADFACAAKAQPVPATVIAGRQLAAGLKLEQDTDPVLFERIGFDRAVARRIAVTSRGRELQSEEAWRDLGQG